MARDSLLSVEIDITGADKEIVEETWGRFVDRGKNPYESQNSTEFIKQWLALRYR